MQCRKQHTVIALLCAVSYILRDCGAVFSIRQVEAVAGDDVPAGLDDGVTVDAVPAANQAGLIELADLDDENKVDDIYKGIVH